MRPSASATSSRTGSRGAGCGASLRWDRLLAIVGTRDANEGGARAAPRPYPAGVFARRAGWELAPSPLAARLAERRKRGLPVLDRAEPNPTQVGLDAPGDALAEALAALASDPAVRAYAPDPRGASLAREAIAAHHASAGTPVSPEQVILTAGTSEGYAHLFRLLGDPGDRVHVPSPGYPLFDHLAAL